MTVFGDKRSATAGSLTISRILPRTNSAAVSFAFAIEQEIDERAEERQAAVLPAASRRPFARSSGVTASAELSVSGSREPIAVCISEFCARKPA